MTNNIICIAIWYFSAPILQNGPDQAKIALDYAKMISLSELDESGDSKVILELEFSAKSRPGGECEASGFWPADYTLRAYENALTRSKNLYTKLNRQSD